MKTRSAVQNDTLLQIVYRPLKSLVPYAKNARTHPRSQIQKLKASLTEFGWANPMLIADGGMLAGHGRLQSAIEMAEQGIHIPRNPDPWMGPTVDLSHLSPSQRRAYILQDNSSALDAEWDPDLLRDELRALGALGFDAALTGFGDVDLGKIFGDRSDPLSEWQGMPEFDQNDKQAHRSIPIHFRDEKAVKAFANLIGQTITAQTRFIWFPDIEIETYVDKQYKAAAE